MVANAVMLPEKINKNRIIERASATLNEPKFSIRMRYGASELITLSRSPIQNNMVMSIAMPMTRLSR